MAARIEAAANATADQKAQIVIPEAEREMLFMPFHRGGDGKGHGLGLSLVRQIARQHGGDARYDGGFVVTLPT